MQRSRYLTKSRFKLALECPTKLFYTKKEEYPDEKLDDSFLEALAEGGFQVGALAKLYHPGGVEVTTLDYEQAVRETLHLLQKEQVIIYEAGVRFNDLFIRTDILVKSGDELQLIEVKAKSIDGAGSEPFITASGSISSGWKPYLYDVAFQRLVLQRAFPEYTITSFLMLADKSKMATVDGLNQRFLISKKNDRTRIIIKESLTPDDLGDEILVKINVDPVVKGIMDGTLFTESEKLSFEQWIYWLADQYKRDKKIPPDIGKKCKDCEFRCLPEQEIQGLKSGYKECWKQSLDWDDADFEEPLVLDIWNFLKKEECLARGKYFMKDISRKDLKVEADDEPGLSRTERQWIQVEKAVKNDTTPYIDKEGLKNEMATWKYPLHFIDFETSAVAIPFFRGMHPYEGIAFQFSHHIVEENGAIEHKGQFIGFTPGKFPGFDFIRELKKQLSQDEGTVFRYHNHENTYLNIIYRQLVDTLLYIQDKDELLDFIREITHTTDKQTTIWCGKRDMVDMHRLVLRYYYDPSTKGSNSLKQVLPAALNSSRYLQEKYVRPIYGKGLAIPSLNFEKQTWITWDNGKVVDPYKLLPPVFEGIDQEKLDTQMTDDMDAKIAEGGAAMTAWARTQFTEMSERERERIKAALLKYCELDTFAMVMLWEYWHHEAHR